MLTRTALIAILCGFLSVPAFAKDYVAERFDSRIEVRPDGSLLVTETIVFRFDSGTFKTVFRTIPTRRTDGVEFVQASMDGRILQLGDTPGSVEVRRKNGLRVDWHFEPVAESTHTFALVYVARGVVRQEAAHDLLAWRALPSEHQYRIRESTVQFEIPAPLSSDVAVGTRRVDGGTRVSVEGRTVTIRAADIRRNGWVEPALTFAPRTVAAAAPDWQQRQARHLALVPTWAAVGGGVFLIGLIALMALRQGYDAPPAGSASWASLLPPDDLPPALAGALAANGGPTLVHAMAALFGLAERGVITIRETRGTFGQRSFMIEREGHAAGLAPHEQAVLDVTFRKTGEREPVSLSTARHQLTRHWRTFKDALNAELRDRGLLDDARRRHRDRFNVLGLVLLIAGSLTVIPVIASRDAYGAWPLLATAAVILVALMSFIFAAAETPLSNEGVRRSQAWRGYQAHLKHPQEIEPRWGASAYAESRILPFVIALGIGSAWSRFMKKRNTRTPAWFRPASELDSGASFAAFVAYGGAHASGGGTGGAGGGGAAGGGASGAG